MQNIRIGKMPVRRMLNALYSLLIDDLITPQLSRAQVREILDDALREMAPIEWQRANWGLTKRAADDQQRAMAMFGG